jgi:hypothetical protein
MDLVRFYLGEASDNQGRMLCDIWGWDYAALEEVHDYIQELFPLPDASRFNPRAPLLDEATAARFREDPVLRTNLLHSLRLMLDFYGFRLDEENREVVRAENFRERAENWLVYSDHNHLRITRILKCLHVCGLGEYAAAFWKALQADATPRDVPEETLRFWREAGTLGR